MGSIECSLHIDEIGKSSLNPELEPYKYKDEVEVPALGMIDDIITISESGYKSTRLNSFLNVKIAAKKLQLGPEKCFVLHIGSAQEAYKQIEQCVNGWKMSEVQDFETGGQKWEDTLDNIMELSHVDSEKYLGQIISSDGKNTKNIQKIKNKGIGIQNKVIQMLEHMPAGIFQFEVAVILRNAYLISSMLCSSEVWYGVTQEEYEDLEKIDIMLFKNLVECSSSVPSELVFLEFGLVPIKQIIQMRRCLFLHHILEQNENSLLFKFFMAQLKNSKQGDWASQVLQDLEDFNIDLQIEEIQNMSKVKFKLIVKDCGTKFAFDRLMEKKEARKSQNARGKNIKYSELKMASYLTSENIDSTIEEKKVDISV